MKKIIITETSINAEGFSTIEIIGLLQYFRRKVEYNLLIEGVGNKVDRKDEIPLIINSDISTRAKHGLKSMLESEHDFYKCSLEILSEITLRDMKKVRGLGEKSIKEIIEEMTKYGIKIKD